MKYTYLATIQKFTKSRGKVTENFIMLSGFLSKDLSSLSITELTSKLEEETHGTCVKLELEVVEPLRRPS